MLGATGITSPSLLRFSRACADGSCCATEAGHAKHAVNIPLDQLSKAVQDGDLKQQSVPLLCICQAGRRSAQAVVKLTKVHGFQDVVNVKGGENCIRHHTYNAVMLDIAANLVSHKW